MVEMAMAAQKEIMKKVDEGLHESLLAKAPLITSTVWGALTSDGSTQPSSSTGVLSKNTFVEKFLLTVNEVIMKGLEKHMESGGSIPGLPRGPIVMEMALPMDMAMLGGGHPSMMMLEGPHSHEHHLGYDFDASHGGHHPYVHGGHHHYGGTSRPFSQSNDTRGYPSQESVRSRDAFSSSSGATPNVGFSSYGTQRSSAAHHAPPPATYGTTRTSAGVGYGSRGGAYGSSGGANGSPGGGYGGGGYSSTYRY